MIDRVLAGLIAAAAVAGIALEWRTLAASGSAPAEIVSALSLYFTILTNAVIAVLFAVLTIRGRAAAGPRLIAGATAAIVLVGVVFALLLSDVRTLAGATATANTLLHRVTPTLTLIYWLSFVPKGALRWRDPVLWALYPMAYLGYALLRGSTEGRYPYPFIDLAALGAGRVAVNSIAIAIGFLIASAAFVAVDGLLDRRSRAG